MINNVYKKIFKQIKKYDTIVIARHIGADPDALGSQFALKEIIKNKNICESYSQMFHSFLSNAYWKVLT